MDAGRTPRVAAARTSYLLITPIRLVLGVLVLSAALLEGAADDNGMAAFGLGAAAAAFLILSDRRALLLRRKAPEPLPDDARFVEHWRAAWHAAVPSTVGVAVLSVIALALEQAVLACLLGGVELGMGLASAIYLYQLLEWESAQGLRLHVELGQRGRRFTAPG